MIQRICIIITLTQRGRVNGIRRIESKPHYLKSPKCMGYVYFVRGYICEILHTCCGRPVSYFATFMNIVKFCSRAVCVYYYSDVL